MGGCVIAVLLSFALAQDPALGPTPDPVAEAPYELVIWGQAALRQGRSELVQELRDAGWKKGRESRGQIVFKPPQAWMGRAVLDYDGTLSFRRPVLVFVNASVENPVAYGQNPHMDRDPGGINYGDDGWATPVPTASFRVLPRQAVLDPVHQRVRERLAPTLGHYREVVEATAVRAPDELR